MNAVWLPSGPTGAIALVAAFVIDRLFGEPPARWHPVVWIGRALSLVGAPWPGRTPRGQFVRGMAFWLRDEVGAVELALARGVQAGRDRLRHIVGRDTRELSVTVVRESALESLAENLNDSCVAPLLWFCLGGLPGALYRFANTADAMWGLRERWEWAGKWAARADDVLSYVPARLTALLLAAVAARWPGGLSREARRTASPNGGWPMGMLALALDVRLSRPGYYILHATGRSADSRDVERGLKLAGRAAWSAVGVAALCLLLS